LHSVLVIAAAYLLGSIPTGYLVVKAKAKDDIRKTGSGGTGATNVSRKAGKAAGVLTLVLDAAKGAAAVLIARQFASNHFEVNWTVAAAGLAVILGHIFPVWLGFRGGKGVATGVGVFLALSPVAVLLAMIVFLPVVALTRYVSLGSILAAAAFPLFLWLFGLSGRSEMERTPMLAVAIAGALLIIVKHHENISRLIKGNENKFS